MVSNASGLTVDTLSAAAEFGRRVSGMDDEALGDAIDEHGRHAIEHDSPVSLNFYLAAVPDLCSRTVPLDAAIDVSLRWLSYLGHAPAAARESLTRVHPALAGAIEEAGALADALVATSDLRRRMETGGVRPLPCEFGPSIGPEQCRFQLVEFLGAGSGGQVYKAVDRALSDRGFSALVAIKVFDAVDSSTWLRERFIEEAAKARRVQHRNVVRVLDRDVSQQGEDFIVYELVEGGTLDGWVKAAPRNLRDRVRVAVGIARGVQAAHSAGVVHCDLKPTNVLMTADGEPRVADFGVAVRREAWAEAVDVASTDRPVGNLAFISPEQYRMEPGALSPLTDVYAVGGILFWVISGRLPNGESLEEIERRHAEGGAAPPLPCADRDLRAVCARALASDPAHRYQSAAQLADDLDSWLALQPIRWTNPSPVRVVSLWARRRPALTIALSALFVLGAASAWVALHLQAEAETARERIRIREEARRTAAAEIKEQFAPAMTLMTAAQPWEALAVVPYFDWILGTSVLGDPGDARPIWTDRVTMVRRMMNAARLREGDHGFETLSLEMTLGFWLLVDRKPQEAAPLLERNREGWHAIVPGESSIHKWGEVLSLVAEAEAVPPGTPAGDLPTRLRRAKHGMPRGPTNTPLTNLVDRTLSDLNGEPAAPQWKPKKL